MIVASIILPIRNEEKFILPCLKSILDNDYPKSDYEIIVVDGESTDNTKRLISHINWKGISHRVLTNPKKIVPCAMNIGIDASKGSYIIRMDAHTLYSKDYIRQCIDLLEKDTAENVGGPMRAISQNNFGNAVALATSSPLGVGNAKFHFENYEGYVDTVYLGAFKKVIFKKIGGFDENFVRNQDDEFNLRLIRAGFRIYLSPSIKSQYFPRSSPRKLWSQYFQYGFWKVRIIQKHRIPASWRHLIPGLFVSTILVSLLAAPLLTLMCLFLILLISLYSAIILIQTVIIKLNHPQNSVLLVPMIFPILHFAYGCGFMFAILRFLYTREKKG